MSDPGTQKTTYREGRSIASVNAGSTNTLKPFKSMTPKSVPAQSEIAPEVTGHGLPLSKREAYNRVHDQHCGSS